MLFNPMVVVTDEAEVERLLKGKSSMYSFATHASTISPCMPSLHGSHVCNQACQAHIAASLLDCHFQRSTSSLSRHGHNP